MSNKLIFCAVLLAFGAQAQAQTAPTFADITNANAELKLQELHNKLDEAKAKASSANGSRSSDLPQAPKAPFPLPAPLAPSAPVSVSAPEPETTETGKVELVAIYGIGTRLQAEVQYKGRTLTVSANGSNSQVGPWHVESVTPYLVSLVRPGKKVKGKKAGEAQPVRDNIFFASDVSPLAPAEQLGANGSSNAGAMGFGSPFPGATSMRAPSPMPAGLMR